MHPKDYFAIKNLRLSNAGRCFVAMPFATEFDDVYSTIKKALTVEDLGFTCIRADELRGGGDIMTDVLSEMEKAEIIIADLTGKNANVFYELGIAHTVKDSRSVLLISQSTDELPFDVQPYRCIKYDRLEVLSRNLTETVREMTPTRKLIPMKRGEHWRASAPVLGDDNNPYRFELSLVEVAENGTVIHLEVFREVGEERELIAEADRTLRLEERLEIPRIRRALKLDTVDADIGEATFCVCDPHKELTNR